MVENISYTLQTDKGLYTHQSSRMESTTVSTSSKHDEKSTTKDRVTIHSESSSALTYSSSMTLNTNEGRKLEMLQSLVANLLKEQGIDTKISLDSGEIDIADISPEEAQALVADDGYFGVEQTSERIFQFAVNIVGGDPSRIEAIKEGIDNGFQEALDAFGGSLPDISYDTYDAVMEKLDAWVQESQTVA